MKHLHWEIVAYESKEEDKLIEATHVNVIQPTEELAMTKAKNLVKKPFYFLSKVTECNSKD